MTHGLTVWSDPGHAWLRVPKAQYPDWADYGTGYGYQDDEAAYLEEDVEIGLFLNRHEELREVVRGLHSVARSPRHKQYLPNRNKEVTA